MSIIIRSTQSLISRQSEVTEGSFSRGAVACVICLCGVALTPVSRVLLTGSDMQDHPAFGMVLMLAVVMGFWGRAQVKAGLSQRRSFHEAAAHRVLALAKWGIEQRGIVLALNVVALFSAVIARPEGAAAGGSHLLSMTLSSLYFVFLILLLFLDDIALLFIGSGHLPGTPGYPGSSLIGAAGSYAISLLALCFLLLFVAMPASPAVGMLTFLAIPALSLGRHAIISHLTSTDQNNDQIIASAQVGSFISMAALVMVLISLVAFAALIFTGDNRVAAAGIAYGFIVLLISEGQGQIFRHVRRVALPKLTEAAG